MFSHHTLESNKKTVQPALTHKGTIQLLTQGLPGSPSLLLRGPRGHCVLLDHVSDAMSISVSGERVSRCSAFRRQENAEGILETVCVMCF